MIRLFIGISIFHHKTLIARQSELINALPKSKIRWASPADFHITLKFLGDTEDYYLNALRQALQQAAQGFSPLELHLSTPGFFGSLAKPRVIWYGVKPHKELEDLQQAIEEHLVQLGFSADEKLFKAHITLGRVKWLTETDGFKQYMDAHSRPKEELFRAEEFHLFKCDLKPRGAEYNIIDSFRLGNP